VSPPTASPGGGSEPPHLGPDPAARSPWARYGIVKPPDRALRLGLLVDDPRRLPRWAVDGVRRLIDSGLAELVVVAAPSARKAGMAARRLRALSAYALARATIWRTPATARVSTADLIRGVPRIAVGLERASPPGVRIGEESLRHVRAAGLDLLLRVGVAGLQVDVTGAATHGIWSIRHGDPARGRGCPPGFWELLDRDPDISVVVERAGQGDDDGRILARAVLAIEPHSYSGTLERVHRAGTDLLFGLCRDLVAGRLPVAVPTPAAACAEAAPGIGPVARLLAATLGAGLRRALYGAFVLKRWSIGRLEGGAGRVLEGRIGGARWIDPGGRTKMLADPMIVPGTAGRTVLCEALDHAVGRGVIDRIEVTDRDGRPGWFRSSGLDRRTVLDVEGLHLSYPLAVRETDGLVVVPEAAGSGGLVSVLLDDDARTLRSLDFEPGLAAVDPTVFRHGDRWWLACTELGRTAGSHLWVFHGPTPRGPWSAHRRNPVLIDAGAARGAGAPFTSEGVLYRPAQDLRGGYGRSIRLMRVRALTPDEFEEELAAEINPEPGGPFPAGLHTLSVDGDSIWIDGYRPVFHPLAGLFRARTRRSRRPAVEPATDADWLA
jgi:hypothetical protein